MFILAARENTYFLLKEDRNNYMCEVLPAALENSSQER